MIPLHVVAPLSSFAGAVEGVVWHSPTHGMVKVHRHHLGLTWPLPKGTPTRLGQAVGLLLDA